MNQTGIVTQEIAINGVRYVPGFLSPAAQIQLRDRILKIVNLSPLFQPVMPRTGKAFSVKMTNCGSLGWVSDREHGYRYQSNHPDTGEPWPDMPSELHDYWHQLTDYRGEPEACLINFYDAAARMGLHQDRDETDMSAPVVSLSLGDTARFRVGGTRRGGKTQSFKLRSGDAVVLQGDARLAYHGVDKILSGSTTLLDAFIPPVRRINLTLRRVT